MIQFHPKSVITFSQRKHKIYFTNSQTSQKFLQIGKPSFAILYMAFPSSCRIL